VRALLPTTLLVALACATPAHAAEVVWLNPPTPQDAARVAAQAGARQGPLTPAAFRAIPVDRRPTDQTAVDVVEDTLADVRVHEKVLDGELLILGGLQTPLEQVRILRDKHDRDVVIRALLYQGFAVDRYWGDTLASAEEARPWKIRIDDDWVEQPWLDAFALDPLRKVGDDDITEAPQRQAYDTLRRTLARATRGTVVAADLPDGAILYLDGEAQDVQAPVAIDVLPGQPWIHVELDGEIIGLMAERVNPAERLEVVLPVSEPDWQALIKVLHGAGQVVPEGIREPLGAFGDEVWFAEGRGEQLRVWSVTPRGVERVQLTDMRLPSAGGSPLGDVSLAGWVGPSWLHSPDLREQDPSAVPDGAGVINSVAPHLQLELAWDRDWLRYGLGVGLTLPLGQHHVALSGQTRMRLRASPQLFVGHPRAQATVGFLLPYHPVVGVQGNVPVPGVDGLEVHGFFRGGPAPSLQRGDGTVWKGSPVVQLGVGIGGRARPE